jgi:predicted O-methyltransferase YrrM
MLTNVKRIVRTWEQQGRCGALTRLLTYVWIQLNGVWDWLHVEAIKVALDGDTVPHTPEEAVREIVEGDMGRSVRPMQVTRELTSFIGKVAARSPRRVLEIGTARGGTLLLLCRFAADDATIVSVDLPFGRNGGGYPRWKQRLYRRFAKAGQSLHLVRGNSHSPDTLMQVQSIFRGGPIDVIFIDADHSYEGAKADFFSYGTLAASDGMIALHDVLPNSNDPSIDVNRFWRELESDKSQRTELIAASVDQGHSGIGVVHLQGPLKKAGQPSKST